MTDLRTIAETARAQHYPLTPFGHLLLTYDPDWEARAVAHLSQPCDQPEPCEMHQQWESHKAKGRPHIHRRYVEGCYRCELGREEVEAAERQNKAERIARIAARLERRRADLARAQAALAAWYSRHATNRDPATVNLKLSKRAWAVTDRLLEQHRRLDARVVRLQGQVALDEGRMRRLADS